MGTRFSGIIDWTLSTSTAMLRSKGDHVDNRSVKGCVGIQLDCSPGARTKNPIPGKPSGLRQIRDYVRKALGEENPDQQK